MKIINHEGKDVTKEFEDAIEVVKKAFQFYIDKENYHWEGCSCHGHYVIDDNGDMADNGMSAIANLEWTLKGE